jgi:hypothetical protein
MFSEIDLGWEVARNVSGKLAGMCNWDKYSG